MHYFNGRRNCGRTCETAVLVVLTYSQSINYSEKTILTQHNTLITLITGLRWSVSSLRLEHLWAIQKHMYLHALSTHPARTAWPLHGGVIGKHGPTAVGWTRPCSWALVPARHEQMKNPPSAILQVPALCSWAAGTMGEFC